MKDNKTNDSNYNNEEDYILVDSDVYIDPSEHQQQENALQDISNHAKQHFNPTVNIQDIGFKKDGIDNAWSSATLSYDPKQNSTNKDTESARYHLLKSQGYKVHYIENTKTDTVCTVFIHPELNDIHIAFRGTKTKTNVKTDLKFIPTSYEDKGNVHRGFNQAYNSIKGPLAELLNKNLKKHTSDSMKFHISGHSLGGALANLCAVDLQKNHHLNVEEVITFGAPRVFDKKAAIYYQDSGLGDKTLRIIQQRDPVPKILTGKIGFRHVGKELKLDPQKGVKLHMLVEYKKCIDKTNFNNIDAVKSVRLFEPNAKFTEKIKARARALSKEAKVSVSKLKKNISTNQLESNSKLTKDSHKIRPRANAIRGG